MPTRRWSTACSPRPATARSGAGTGSTSSAIAETNGYERDGPKPNAWRYRDYVIRAFNDDKPYDRFVREQLAGDELPDGGGDGLIATGYYRLGIWDDEPADREQARFEGLDDIVATTGQVFLGLTVDCARCHDHKFDPIPQKDYSASCPSSERRPVFETKARPSRLPSAPTPPAGRPTRRRARDRRREVGAGSPRTPQIAPTGPTSEALHRPQDVDRCGGRARCASSIAGGGASAVAGPSDAG